MKRILVLILSIISLSGYAQTVTGNKAKFRTSIELADYRIVYFDNDTNLTANSQSRLVTQYALKKYIDSHGGGVVPGANKQVIFNDNGNLGADTALTFAKSLGQLYLNKGTLAVKGLSTTSATRSLQLMDSNGDTRFAVLDNGMLEIGKQTNAATQNTAVIKAAGADADIGLVLMPKGNGAITAQVPDGTVAGGNARGQYAVDLQMLRAANTQVASGLNSTVAGGHDNTASGPISAVAGGRGNTASAHSSTVAGGRSNTASGYSSTVAGGYNCTASAQNSTVAGGYNNTASGQYSFVTNTENFATGLASSAFGRQAKAYMYGQHSIGVNVGINTFGHGQATMLPMAQNSTGTSDFFVKAGHNFAGGEGTGDNFNPDGTNRIIRATLQVAIVCNNKGDSGTLTTGDAYTSDITFAVQKVSNNISILGTVDEEKVKASAAMSSLVINVSADNATKEVKIKVTPPSGTGSTTKFRAVATLRCTEVAW